MVAIRQNRDAIDFIGEELKEDKQVMDMISKSFINFNKTVSKK